MTGRARRPVFLPPRQAPWRIRTIEVEFPWYPGFSREQKRKCVAALHEAARERLGVAKPLEISSASQEELGFRLSAFQLAARAPDGSLSTVEALFQGSKVFEDGGPYTDLYGRSGREARNDPRLVDARGERRKRVAFRFGDETWPVESLTAFYDWLYVRALCDVPDLARQLAEHDAFTDIAFNPARSLNCQARAAAVFLALQTRLGGLSELAELVKHPDRFRKAHREVVSGEPAKERGGVASSADRQGSLDLGEAPVGEPARARAGRAGGASGGRRRRGV